jgi:hypothetical protein
LGGARGERGGCRERGDRRIWSGSAELNARNRRFFETKTFVLREKRPGWMARFETRAGVSGNARA